MEFYQPIHVEPKSRLELRALAHSIRSFLNIEPDDYFPAVEVLEVLQFFVPDAYFEIVPVSDLPQNTHAYTNISKKSIVIREDVYDGACKGNGRDRMTIVHEFAHFFMLCFFGFKLTRSFGQSIKAYCDPEWQAKCLAGELMMDSRAIAGMDASTVVEKYGVSEDAAIMQLSKI